MMLRWEPSTAGKLEHQTWGLQEQVSDGPSHTPAVPKAVPMPGLATDRFYTLVITMVITGDTFECLYRKMPQK